MRGECRPGTPINMSIRNGAEGVSDTPFSGAALALAWYSLVTLVHRMANLLSQNRTVDARPRRVSPGRISTSNYR